MPSSCHGPDCLRTWSQRARTTAGALTSHRHSCALRTKSDAGTHRQAVSVETYAAICLPGCRVTMAARDEDELRRGAVWAELSLSSSSPPHRRSSSRCWLQLARASLPAWTAPPTRRPSPAPPPRLRRRHHPRHCCSRCLCSPPDLTAARRHTTHPAAPVGDDVPQLPRLRQGTRHGRGRTRSSPGQQAGQALECDPAEHRKGGLVRGRHSMRSACHKSWRRLLSGLAPMPGFRLPGPSSSLVSAQRGGKAPGGFSRTTIPMGFM